MEKQTRKSLAKKFLTKFREIPREKWCVGRFTSRDGGAHCAIGHVLENKNIISRFLLNRGWLLNPAFEQEAMLLIKLTNQDNDDTKDIAAVNNGDCPEYQQETPKERVCARLNDIIREENGL